MSDGTDALHRVADDPGYQRLLRRRGMLGASLTMAMLVVYFGFILLVAFAKPLLAQPIAGGATSLGIPIGFGVILFAVALTGIYVHRANREFDAEVARLVAEFRA